MPAQLYDDMTTSSFSVKSGGKNGVPEYRPKPTLVQFSENNSVYTVSRVEDEEKTDYWYTMKDYMFIKFNNSSIAKQLKQGTFFETDKASSRGLEHKTREGNRARKEHKLNALGCVLEEQERQLNTGVYDMGAIAEIYSRIAACTRENAFRLALRDAEESADYLQIRFEPEEALSVVSSVLSSDFDDSSFSDSDQSGNESRASGVSRSIEELTRIPVSRRNRSRQFSGLLVLE